MSTVVLSQALAARIEKAMRAGLLPPIEFQRLSDDIKGDRRVAALRASIAGVPDVKLVEIIDLKCRYLALRYDEWLDRAGV